MDTGQENSNVDIKVYKVLIAYILSSAFINVFLDGLDLLKGFFWCHTEDKEKSLQRRDALILNTCISNFEFFFISS